MNSGSPLIEDVSLDELKQGLAEGSILLVDVREPNEWNAGHIAGATLHPMSTIDPSALPGLFGKRVVLHCRSGNRSAKAPVLARMAPARRGRWRRRGRTVAGMCEYLSAAEDTVARVSRAGSNAPKSAD